MHVHAMRIQTTAIRGSMAAVVLLLAVILPSAAAAQAAEADHRWLPWLGCWEAVGADPSMICIRPEAEGGVELLTFSDARVVERRTIRADGIERVADREGCEGREWAEFSPDGRRVYLNWVHVCPGGVERTSQGLLAMAGPDQWVDVAAVQVAGRNVAWVRRYREASPRRVEAAGMEEILEGRGMAVATARLGAAAPLTVDDLIEAASRVNAEAVRAWIAERSEPIELGARGLVRLAEAGVPAEVIDVAVAVTYPERFALARDRQPPDARRPYYDPWLYPPHWSISPFYRHGFYLDPYWGFFGPRFPTQVVVVPITRPDPPPRGRVVRDRGYTRSGSGGAVGSAVPRSSTPSTPSSSAGSRSGTGSSVSTPSPSRGASTGRRAKPRGSGGD